MAKEISKYITVHFNHRVAASNSLTPKQVEGISKDFETLNIKKLEKNQSWGLLGWVMLVGRKGEVAYLDEASLLPRYPRRDPKIIFEFPLSVTVDEIRFFTENAIKIFKDKFEQDSEMSFEGGFRSITKRPYKEHFSSILKRKIRSRTYADKKPHGSNSLRPAYKERRDAWIREEYKKHQKAGTNAEMSYFTIQGDLKKLPLSKFGEWPDKKIDPDTGKSKAIKKSPLDLSIETIKDLIHRKS